MYKGQIKERCNATKKVEINKEKKWLARRKEI